MNQNTQLRQLIRESIQEYIKEINAAGDRAALEAKINATQEAIDKRKKLTAMEGLDEAYQEYLDERKMKEMTSEIKMLEKSMSKYQKMLEKMDAKKEPKIEEIKDEEVMDEVTIDPPSGAQLEENVDKEMYYEIAQQMKNDGMSYDEVVIKLEDMGLNTREAETITMNTFKEEMEEDMSIYEILHMQKLAGIISETEYTAKLEEAKKKMTAAQKEKKEDIVKSMKKSKSFGKSKEEKAKMYATATKLATKKK